MSCFSGVSSNLLDSIDIGLILCSDSMAVEGAYGCELSLVVAAVSMRMDEWA